MNMMAGRIKRRARKAPKRKRKSSGRVSRRRIGGRLQRRGAGWFTNVLGKIWNFGKKGYAAYKSSPAAQSLVKSGISMAKDKLDSYGAKAQETKAEGYRRRRGRPRKSKPSTRGRRRRGGEVGVSTLSGPLP